MLVILGSKDVVRRQAEGLRLLPQQDTGSRVCAFGDSGEAGSSPSARAAWGRSVDDTGPGT